MKRITALLSAAAIGLALVLASAPASAAGSYGGGGWRGGGGWHGGSGWHGGGHWHGGYGGHWHGGVFVGVGGWWPGYWGWGPYWGGPYYYGWGYSPTVVYQQEPRVYMEQGDAGASAQSNSSGQWWYWCASAHGYYPYVTSCTEGWQRVPPQPTQPVR